MSTTKAFRGFVPARMKGGAYNNEAVTDMITLPQQDKHKPLVIVSLLVIRLFYREPI